MAEALYTSTTNLLHAFPRLQTTGLTASELEHPIRRAGAIVDSMLSGRYSTPFATTPDTPAIVREVVEDLALLDLIDRFPNAPDWIIRRAERAWEILRMLRDGTMDVPGGEELSGSEGLRSTTRNYVPTFGVAPSVDERVDPNRADDERTDREG